MTKEQKQAVEAHFRARLETQGVPLKSRTALKMQVEFFAGAMAAFDAIDKSQPSAHWVLSILSGRPILEETDANRKAEIIEASRQ